MKCIACAFVFMLTLASCHDDPPVPIDTYEPTTQTLFVYMPWTGSAASSSGALTEYFDKNIDSMRRAINVGKGVKGTDIIVFKANNQSQSVIFRMKYNTARQRCEFDTLKANAGYVSVSEANLESLLNLITSYSNTGKYRLLIGSHGSGWTLKGSDATMPRDGSRSFGGSGQQYQYDISELKEAIARSAMKKVEYICFDDCYMANVETAYALKDVTDYLVASTSEVMADGMPYQLVFGHMTGQTDYRKWLDGFYQYYMKTSYPYGAFSAIRCGKYIENMAAAMRAINQTYTFNTAKLNAVQYLDGYDNHVFFDLGAYVEQLGVLPPLLTNFDKALQALVVHKVSTPYIYTIFSNAYRPGDAKYPNNTFKVDKFCGVTISDPTRNATVFDAKQQTAWWKATH